ncbi:MAG: type II toxin-antitoxin system RelE/ParE family toxin [Tannerellaceae bacterium]|jgi:proteic killer suppression protein|nr:type II toxin-antitoxin system RelE/ParE family toxin [Tannerellaceae bacterium]
MVVTFEEEYLEELYETEKSTDKKHRFQPHVITRYIRCIDALMGAPNTEALYTMKSLHYEKLKGDKKGISSVRVNDQYRVEFTETQVQETETIITICNILDLSNHYK